MTYQGQEDATRDRVRRYLEENYSDPDGTPLSAARLTELLTDHSSIVELGIDHLSYAYHVGDKIAEAAGPDWVGEDSDDGDEGGDGSDESLRPSGAETPPPDLPSRGAPTR
jgi:hypothetical protein